MVTIYQITVTNESPSPHTMYFFQQPAVYTGGAQVYSNSLASMAIAAKPPSGGQAQLQFQTEVQYYAGIQTQTSPQQVGLANLSSIYEVEIGLRPNSGTVPPDATNMAISPLLLTPPVSDGGVPTGSFRITTPAFNPNNQRFNAGLAAKANGMLLLSNFVNADPNLAIDVQPVVIFYVAVGSYQAGTVVDFSQSSVNAAICNATDGTENFKVTYNVDGTWTVS